MDTEYRMKRYGNMTLLHAPPSGLTQVVPRMREDILALMKLSGGKLPPLRVVRPTGVANVFYGFADASGKQFGSTVSAAYGCSGRLAKANPSTKDLVYRVGVWSAAEEQESSNFKELSNLVETVEEETRRGRLVDCEFFLFTDNSTAEICYYRGS